MILFVVGEAQKEKETENCKQAPHTVWSLMGGGGQGQSLHPQTMTWAKIKSPRLNSRTHPGASTHDIVFNNSFPRPKYLLQSELVPEFTEQEW